MSIRVGINGFGRIGRSFFRAVEGRDDIEVVAVNDLVDPTVLASLLTYDTVLGELPGGASVDGNQVTASGRTFTVLGERNPADLPWRDLGVDIVIESTGVFTDAAKARAHLDAGARKVVIAAPATGEDYTLVVGVNDAGYDKDAHDIVSNASCTTNCLAPMAKVLDDAFGIQHGIMGTVHAYTQDQMLQDGPHKDLRRARAAAQNIVPTSTGAAKAIGKVLPQLEGKLDGYSLRVPVIVGSIVELTVTVGRDVTVDDVNAAFAQAAQGDLAHVLKYSTAPLVSSDIVTTPWSCTFDAPLTKVVAGRQVTVLGWYDNEWGFSNRLVDLVGIL